MSAANGASAHADQWSCQVRHPGGQWECVGVGATENRATAEEDVRAWQRDVVDYEVRLACRVVGPWEAA